MLAKFVTFGVLACGIQAAVVAGVEPDSHSSRTTPSPNSPVMATLHGDAISPYLTKRDLGRLPDGFPIPRLVLHLKRSQAQQAKLDRLLVLQHNPKSPYFHQWLSPAQFGKRFGPSQSDIQAVVDWLRAEAFHIQSISPSGMDIVFSGNAGGVRYAFHTELHRYQINGEVRIAASTDPQIPIGVASRIKSVGPLTGAHARPLTRKVMPHPVKQGLSPDFTTTNGQYLLVGPQDYIKIYNLAPIWNAGIRGAGQTIAVVGDSDMLPQDWLTFRNAFLLSSYTGTLTTVNPGGCTDPGFNNNEVEAALDTEWAGVTAPDASIELATCKDSFSLGDGVATALQNLINAASPPPIISMSFGSCEVALGSGPAGDISDLFEQATAEGISVFVATGDSGSADCDPDENGHLATQGLQVNAYASSAFAVAVGGTDFSD